MALIKNPWQFCEVINSYKENGYCPGSFQLKLPLSYGTHRLKTDANFGVGSAVMGSVLVQMIYFLGIYRCHQCHCPAVLGSCHLQGFRILIPWDNSPVCCIPRYVCCGNRTQRIPTECVCNWGSPHSGPPACRHAQREIPLRENSHGAK